jgi:hypothetical protein
MTDATTANAVTPTPVATEENVPVSAARVNGCLNSAVFWVQELPRYADRNQRKADAWAIAAGILSALTSLAIWPIVTNDASAAAKVVVSAVALAAAVCALVPRVMNYSELAGAARELASRYGNLTGQLIDLHEMGDHLDQSWALRVVNEFSAVKEKKDSLRGLPDKLKVEMERNAMRARAGASAKTPTGAGQQG